jgi:hypothetical protein
MRASKEDQGEQREIIPTETQKPHGLIGASVLPELRRGTPGPRVSSAKWVPATLQPLSFHGFDREKLQGHIGQGDRASFGRS